MHRHVWVWSGHETRRGGDRDVSIALVRRRRILEGSMCRRRAYEHHKIDWDGVET